MCLREGGLLIYYPRLHILYESCLKMALLWAATCSEYNCAYNKVLCLTITYLQILHN